MFKYPGLNPFPVPAEREEGINTGILIKAGETITIDAAGVITYDSGYHFANPDGMLCTYKGQPLAHPQAMMPVVWPHDGAYVTDKDRPGVIGSLFGWIGEYSEESAFLIGTHREIVADRDGFLHLAVNDAKGTYSDNQGEYRVTVKVS